MNGCAEEVILHTGQFHFGGGRLRLRTLLGSCIAVTVWHPGRLIGGMCHYMLPSPVLGKTSGSEQIGLYATGAIELFLREMRARGTAPVDYVVKMFGGGNMFPAHMLGTDCHEACLDATRSACRDISCKNVRSGRDLLGQSGFVVSNEDVGGTDARSLIFEVWNGDVWVRRTPSRAAGAEPV